MQEKLKEIPNGVETMYVVADFAKMSTIQEYKEAIADKLTDIDIGMLILNAGWAEFGPFEWVSNEIIEDHIRINLLHVVYTAKVLASKMINRFDVHKQKCGMAIVSSGLGLNPIAGCIAYSASKGFVSFLAQGLNVEFNGKIDVLCYHAGLIKTKFIKEMD
jgi:short-subunit dehydrogenase